MKTGRISRDFRKDFVWGAATSAYQIEGAVKEDGKPIDVYGQNIYNGYCVWMGEDGRSETVSRYEGFPKTAIVLPAVTDG